MFQKSYAYRPVEPGRSRSKYWIYCFAILLLCIACVLQMILGQSWTSTSGHAWGADDAYISFRYAENLFMGNGLVYNEGERVEGYSNFLFTLVMTPAFAVSEDFPYWFAVGLGILSAVAVCTLLYYYLYSAYGSLYAGLGILAFVTFPPVWIWAVSGLETMPVVLCQMIIWIAVERLIQRETLLNSILLAIGVVFLVLLRADGFVAPAIAVVYLFLVGRFRLAVSLFLILAFSVATVFYSRFEYYGYFLPNTYYAKVSGSLCMRLEAAIGQLTESWSYAALIPFFASVFLGLASWLYRCRFKGWFSPHWNTLPFSSFLAVSWMAYWLFIGGDVFYERFLLLIVPLGVVQIIHCLKTGFGEPKAAIIAIALCIVFQLCCFGRDGRLEWRYPKYDCWITLGKFLRVQEAKSIAVDAAGKIPFYSRLTTIDMLGLNDEFLAHRPSSFFVVGHNKFDPDYVLSRKPDLIAAWLVSSSLDMHWGLSRSKYRKAGYKVKWLLNMQRQSKEPNIIDVEKLEDQKIMDLANEGYNYAVLRTSAVGLNSEE